MFDMSTHTFILFYNIWFCFKDLERHLVKLQLVLQQQQQNQLYVDIENDLENETNLNLTKAYLFRLKDTL